MTDGWARRHTPALAYPWLIPIYHPVPPSADFVRVDPLAPSEDRAFHSGFAQRVAFQHLFPDEALDRVILDPTINTRRVPVRRRAAVKPSPA